MTNTQLLDDSKADHMTRKDVNDTGQTATIPAPSGRGEDSTGEAESTQLLHDIHSFYAEQAVENERICRAQYEEWRKREQCRLWLEHIGSPLAPYTMTMQDEAARVGSNVYMCAAVSNAESSGGLVCHDFNAWGLGGSTNYRTFGCWEEGIAAFYDFLYQWDICRGYPAIDGHSTPNYCEPNEPWMTNVDGAVRDIQAFYVPPYKSGP